MRALTVHQPWAALIARGVKRVENRTWSTPYRGPLAIHAGASRASLHHVARLRAAGITVAVDRLVFGAIIAVAYLVDVVSVEDITDPSDALFAQGPWCWVLRDVRAITPIPCRGAQGLWTPDADVLARVRAA